MIDLATMNIRAPHSPTTMDTRDDTDCSSMRVVLDNSNETSTIQLPLLPPPATTTTPPPTTKPIPMNRRRRPVVSMGDMEDDYTRQQAAASVAGDPLPFPSPIALKGGRVDVFLRKARTGKIVKTKALIRSRNPSFCYVEDKSKKRIPTNMGYVMFCFAVPRARTSASVQSSSLWSHAGHKHRLNSSSSSNNNKNSNNNNTLLFEIPKDSTKISTVAVKMCSWDKIMEFRQDEKAEDPLQEIAAMQAIGDNRHVLGCGDVISDDKYLYVVMPFCQNGDLLTLIYNGTMGGLSEPVARYIFRQILLSLQYLRSWGIVHRDVSGENIMIDENGRCVLIDLGMAIRVPSGMEGADRAMLKPQGSCGKLPYMAPEVYANTDEFDGYSADLWSAAVVLFSMLTGENESAIQDGCRILYKKAKMSDPIFQVLTRPDKTGLQTLLEFWDIQGISKDAIDLMQNIFQVNPKDRLTLDEVMVHPWVTNADTITQEEMMYFLMLEGDAQ